MSNQNIFHKTIYKICIKINVCVDLTKKQSKLVMMMMMKKIIPVKNKNQSVSNSSFNCLIIDAHQQQSTDTKNVPITNNRLDVRVYFWNFQKKTLFKFLNHTKLETMKPGGDQLNLVGTDGVRSTV